jgi:glycosyltransferase involved in cell wall biosynthesis
MPHDFDGTRRRGGSGGAVAACDQGNGCENGAVARPRVARKRLNVLALTKYEDLAASSRYRFLNYIPLLEHLGVEVVVEPLLSNNYVQRRQSNQHVGLREIARAFLRRVSILLRSRRFDMVWVEGELFPRLPAVVERLFSRFRIPYVVDIDDAIFHAYDRHPSAFYRSLMGRKIDVVMSRANAVIAGNAYLAERARAAGARKVVLVPTAIDHTVYRSAAGRQRPVAERNGEALTIGWIGSPVTAKYLRSVERALARFTAQRMSDVVLVGAGEFDLNVERLVKRPWSAERELSDIASFDIGIAPLVDGAWERGKCGLKAIQYMGMGVPVVASNCGALPSIIGEPASGLLYREEEEFYSCLDRLSQDADLRNHLGENGRRRVAEEYTIHRWSEIVADTLRGAA